MNGYLAVLKKYAEFGGRASRREFWMFALINLVVYIVLAIVDGAIGTRTTYGLGALGLIYSLAVLLPSIAVTIRRLHDTGRSGWWLLIAFVPVIGPVVLIVFYILESQAGDNQYGPDPRSAAS